VEWLLLASDRVQFVGFREDGGEFSGIIIGISWWADCSGWSWIMELVI